MARAGGATRNPFRCLQSTKRAPSSEDYGPPACAGDDTSRDFSSPHFLAELDDHAELRPLLVLGQNIALLGRRKAALRREAELIEADVFGRFLDPPLDVVLGLERAGLRGHEAEHHDLVAFGQEPQRLEAAGALAVVFEKVAVVVAAGAQGFRHRPRYRRG